ncbi:lysozyme inhibitor LprI family protein [Niallia sp. FSL M8-0099]|uniref:lysozyme inhibitor LprI family protein n=1 Tax=Niallia sp. FSL M8-0099 TaxID=2954519 RepID=UPI0030FAC866
MKKSSIFFAATLLVLLLAGMSACSNASESDSSNNSNNNQSESDSSNNTNNNQSESDSSNNTNNKQSETDQKAENTDVSSPSNEASADRTETAVNSKNSKMDKPASEDKSQAVDKVEGRKAEFIAKLDNIQKEVDAMPDKKDSDKGVTNAMINYYGVSYEKYDEALNEIYSILKAELSPEVMNNLKTDQVKWIEQKEAAAKEERSKYSGGTFENVANYISLYESTKKRCYELVNEYMAD